MRKQRGLGNDVPVDLSVQVGRCTRLDIGKAGNFYLIIAKTPVEIKRISKPIFSLEQIR